MIKVSAPSCCRELLELVVVPLLLVVPANPLPRSTHRLAHSHTRTQRILFSINCLPLSVTCPHHAILPPSPSSFAAKPSTGLPQHELCVTPACPRVQKSAEQQGRYISIRIYRILRIRIRIYALCTHKCIYLRTLCFVCGLCVPACVPRLLCLLLSPLLVLRSMMKHRDLFIANTRMQLLI